ALLFRGAVVRDQGPGHPRGGRAGILARVPVCAGRAGAARGQVRPAHGLRLVRRRPGRPVLPLPMVRRSQGEAQGCLVVGLSLTAIRVPSSATSGGPLPSPHLISGCPSGHPGGTLRRSGSLLAPSTSRCPGASGGPLPEVTSR